MKTTRLPRVKAAVITAGIATTLLGGAVITAPTASASAIKCSTSKRVANGNAMYGIVPAATTGTTSCTLATGSGGAGVRVLQTTLNKCYGRDAGGWDLGISITVDGSFGAQTKSALKKVQQKLKDSGYYSGAVDGIYGPKTSKALHHRMYYTANNRFNRCFRVLS